MKNDRKNKKENFLEGYFYFVEEFIPTDVKNLTREFKMTDYSECWDIKRGIILPNNTNRKLKFDIIPTKDYWDCFFTGFIYDDNTFYGWIKYVKEANLKDCTLSGRYIHAKSKSILLCGIWEHPDGTKEFFWADLG